MKSHYSMMKKSSTRVSLTSMWKAWIRVGPGQYTISNYFLGINNIRDHFRNPMNGMYRPDLAAITPATAESFEEGEGLYD